MSVYAKCATVGFRFVAVLTALSGVMTLATGTPIFALISAVTGALLYASSRALGIAIARDVD